MQVKRLFEFEAAHILPRHPGKCKRLHGHSWRMEVELHGRVDNETGFVMDFGDLKKLVQPIVDRFDHRLLNCFVRYPSSENITIHVAHLLRPQLNWENVDRLIVRVSETRNTWAEWDSYNNDDEDIFDRMSLDSSDTSYDAGWRAPEIPSCPDVPQALKALEQIVPEMWDVYLGQLVRLEQLRLYVDTMNPNPELPEELRKEEDGNKEEQNGAGVEATDAERGTQTQDQTSAVVDEV